MTMSLGKQSLLLLTNASIDVITKSKARELFLHYKTYTVRQNKPNHRKPLYNGHLETTETGRSSQAVCYMEVPCTVSGIFKYQNMQIWSLNMYVNTCKHVHCALQSLPTFLL